MRYFHSSQSVNTSRIRILALRQIQKSIRSVRSVGNIQNGATLTRRDGEETKGSPPFNEHLWCDFKCSPWAKKLITKHQWLVHSLHGQKYWHPFFRTEKGSSKLCQQRWKHNSCTKKIISTSVASVLKCMIWLNLYVDVISVWWWVCVSFKVTPEVFSCFLQTSQVLPHWLNHHFSLILVLYTETLSC